MVFLSCIQVSSLVDGTATDQTAYWYAGAYAPAYRELDFCLLWWTSDQNIDWQLSEVMNGAEDASTFNTHIIISVNQGNLEVRSDWGVAGRHCLLTLHSPLLWICLSATHLNWLLNFLEFCIKDMLLNVMCSLCSWISWRLCTHTWQCCPVPTHWQLLVYITNFTYLLHGAESFLSSQLVCS